MLIVGYQADLAALAEMLLHDRSPPDNLVQ
jgi:hypothetical protein